MVPSRQKRPQEAKTLIESAGRQKGRFIAPKIPISNPVFYGNFFYV
jgi:hypothetical protein